MKYSLKLLLTISITALSTTWAAGPHLPGATDDTNVGEHAVEMTSRPTSATSERGAAAALLSPESLPNVPPVSATAGEKDRGASEEKSSPDSTHPAPVTNPLDPEASDAVVSTSGPHDSRPTDRSVVSGDASPAPSQHDAPANTDRAAGVAMPADSGNLAQLISPVATGPAEAASMDGNGATPLTLDLSDVLSMRGLTLEQRQALQVIYDTFQRQNGLEAGNRTLLAGVMTETESNNDQPKPKPKHSIMDIIGAIIENLDAPQNSTGNTWANLDEIQHMFIDVGVSETHKRYLSEKQHRMANAVRVYIDQIIDYRISALTTLTVAHNITTLLLCIVAHSLLATESWEYAALPPFTGGVTLWEVNQLLQVWIPQLLNFECFDCVHKVLVPEYKIQSAWKEHFKNMKAVLPEVLGYAFAFQEKDLSPEELKQALNDAFSTSGTLSGAFQQLFQK